MRSNRRRRKGFRNHTICHITLVHVHLCNVYHIFPRYIYITKIGVCKGLHFKLDYDNFEDLLSFPVICLTA